MRAINQSRLEESNTFKRMYAIGNLVSNNFTGDAIKRLR